MEEVELTRLLPRRIPRRGLTPGVRRGANLVVVRARRDMPRRAREEGPGAVHHVYAHAVASEPLFVDSEDVEEYLRGVGRVVEVYGWRVLSFCLMGNHIHLLVETPEPNLGEGMQRLHGQYARYFNQRHAGSGHRFRGRYGNRRVRGERQFYAIVRYIAQNPCEARLCSLPEEWPWSSHGGLLREDAPPWLDRDWLLEFFASRGGDPLDRYRRFVAGEVVAAAGSRAA